MKSLSPFKVPAENENAGIKKFIEQNNFTNLHLHTIGKQLDRTELSVQKPPSQLTPKKELL